MLDVVAEIKTAVAVIALQPLAKKKLLATLCRRGDGVGLVAVFKVVVRAVKRHQTALKTGQRSAMPISTRCSPNNGISACFSSDVTCGLAQVNTGA